MSMIYSDLARKICSEKLVPFLQDDSDSIVVIGIDGPTAAGKTIFADSTAQELRTSYLRRCWIYRMDWTLAPRQDRLDDLADLRTKKIPFSHEGELHMRLARIREFLETVRAYNERINTKQVQAPEIVRLEGLYSRETGGSTNGECDCILEPGLVILVEGHYTLRVDLNNLIDLNILMLGETEELISRKTARVRGYRPETEAREYFSLVDLPSFHRHLGLFGHNASLVIDNTDFRRPEVHSYEFIDGWLARNLPEPATEGTFRVGQEGTADIADRVLSVSHMMDHSIRAALSAALETVFDWDRHVSQFLRISVDDIPEDLTSISAGLVSSLNGRFSGGRCSFILKHTNALYNVYSRILPITIGLELRCERPIRILADVFHDFLRLQITWAGGYFRFMYERKAGEIEPAAAGRVNETTQEGGPRSGGEHVRVITPSQFMLPDFLNEFQSDVVFSGREEENISASQALAELTDKGEVWIHRFAKFSELNYFYNIVIDTGGNAVKAGNYLIAVWSKNERLMSAFKTFRTAWTAAISEADHISADEELLDQIVDAERAGLRSFILEHCPDFAVLDGYLHCSGFLYGSETWEGVVGQLGLMLDKGPRLVRKRAVQYIQKCFPGISLEVEKLWDNLPIGSRKHISLDTLTFISPTILSEVYLWTALRGDNSAILGVNIYDIRNSSIDCRACLGSASARHTAVVLQGTLNALGPREEYNGKEVHGYLRPLNGSADLVEAALTAARDIVLISGDAPPLFGVGLDHISADGDHPRGRAERFLHKAMISEAVTHYMLDGSALFSHPGNAAQGLEKQFAAVTGYAVSLLEGKPASYIYDKEISLCSLSYTDQPETEYIPTPAEVELFVRIYRRHVSDSGLGANNTRPALIVGNLGTTHHSRDRGMVVVEMARQWRDRVKRHNFVSAVLHGTTNTHYHVLAKAAAGCHKINIAGDSLGVLLRALPERLRKSVLKDDVEPKKMLASVRNEMNSMSAAEIREIEDSLKAYFRAMMDNVNSPRLSPMDVEYFRYKNYKFTQRQIHAICDEIKVLLESRQLFHSDAPAYGAGGYKFFASLVEVPFDEGFRRLLSILWEEGTRCFHVDAGDGKFIPRAFSGLAKTEYIRKTFPGATIHCHLMAENPGIGAKGGLSMIEQYADAGCDAIAVHKRSFKDEHYFLSAIELIRKLGGRPGIIIETSDAMDAVIGGDIIKSLLEWVVVMGVPVGYGGQIFDMSTLNRIAWLYRFSRTNNLPLLIEVDGGLTLENISLCRKAGAQAFSGYSLIRSSSEKEMRAKLHKVFKLLDSESPPSVI